jgi:hypothetical protein
VSTYEIDQKTGHLRKLAPVDVGKNPNWIEIIWAMGEVLLRHT